MCINVFTWWWMWGFYYQSGFLSSLELAPSEDESFSSVHLWMWSIAVTLLQNSLIMGSFRFDTNMYNLACIRASCIAYHLLMLFFMYIYGRKQSFMLCVAIITILRYGKWVARNALHSPWLLAWLMACVQGSEKLHNYFNYFWPMKL